MKQFIFFQGNDGLPWTFGIGIKDMFVFIDARIEGVFPHLTQGLWRDPESFSCHKVDDFTVGCPIMNLHLKGLFQSSSFVIEQHLLFGLNMFGVNDQWPFLIVATGCSSKVVASLYIVLDSRGNGIRPIDVFPLGMQKSSAYGVFGPIIMGGISVTYTVDNNAIVAFKLHHKANVRGPCASNSTYGPKENELRPLARAGLANGFFELQKHFLVSECF
ncbi:MAG: hypothetical protein NWS95_07970 [Schleiferiaceae bacterium]|nr:hypothetical protein [Schleiferiaceae bacterium]